MKKTTSILWGCVLVALGVILGINALGIAQIDIFFQAGGHCLSLCLVRLVCLAMILTKLVT